LAWQEAFIYINAAFELESTQRERDKKWTFVVTLTPFALIMTLGVIGLAAVTAIVVALSKSSKALDNGVGKLPCKCIQFSNLIWD